MKVAIIGSRGLTVSNFDLYLPDGVTEIVSGGAKGIDTCAHDYAVSHNIKLTEFLPDYQKYGHSAPLKRNDTIIQYSDLVLAFWNGKSRGTAYVIKKCDEFSAPVTIFTINGSHITLQNRNFGQKETIDA